MRKSVNFFDHQFQRQVATGEFALNPFEEAVLPYLSGGVLDLGCGLGNLAIAAAKQGCAVTALDGSRAAVDRINQVANRLHLCLAAYEIDLGNFEIERTYDCVVSIGLLMFLPKEKASALLAGMLPHVKAGGIIVLNVLVEGTSFMGMFEPGHYCLFGENELDEVCRGWEILLSRRDEFPAPENTLKRFHTLVARKPL